MEFHNSPEFEKLPDEFNRNYREVSGSGTDKRKIMQLILCFFTVTVLIFPITINARGDHPPVPYDPDFPVIIDPDPEPDWVEYSIVGKWQIGIENFYEFFENGTGYWSDGKLFVLLHWEKQDHDYHITGKGVTLFNANTIVCQEFNETTAYQNGNLILSENKPDGSMMIGSYQPGSMELDLTNIMPLFETRLKDRLEGSWEHLYHITREEDGIYTCLSYIEFEGDQARFLFASTVSGDWSEYQTGYEFDEYFPDCKIMVGYDTPMELNDIYVDGKGYYSYTGQGLTLYSLIIEDGEYLIADGLSSRTVMEKFVWNE